MPRSEPHGHWSAIVFAASRESRPVAPAAKRAVSDRPCQLQVPNLFSRTALRSGWEFGVDVLHTIALGVGHRAISAALWMIL
jgi:hypothetical protein